MIQKHFKRRLTVPQQSAYDGARVFFMCFIPIAMAYGLFLYCLYQNMSQFGIQEGVHLFIMIGSFVVSVRFYKKCHEIGNEPVQIRAKVLVSQVGLVEEEGNRNGELENEHQKYILSKSSISEAETDFLRMDQISRKVNCKTNCHGQMNLNLKEQYSPNKFLTDPFDKVCQKQIRPTKYYCKICEFQCPYRARHCQKCNTCILRYDHHCFWIGNCVGMRNHYHFYMFLLFQSINNFSTTLLLYKILSQANVSSLYLYISVIILFFTALGFLLFTTYLFLYHTMLVMTGMTTWEHMRRDRISYMIHLNRGFNPFTDGIIKNVKDFIRKQWVSIGKYGGNGREWQVPGFQQAKELKGGNLIDNQYYSCC